MTTQIKGELILVLQIVLGIIIGFLLTRFVFIFSNSYSFIYVIAVLLGGFSIYLGLTKKFEFIMFMFTCLYVGIACSFIY